MYCVNHERGDFVDGNLSEYLYTYERWEAGVKLPAKAPYEADMTPEFRTENFCSPTNFIKSHTNVS